MCISPRRLGKSVYAFAAEVAPTFTEAITPYLPTIGLLGAGALAGIFAIYNRKRGATEGRAPDVNEIWLRQAEDQRILDIERRARRHLEDMIERIRTAFKMYIIRVSNGGSTELSLSEQDILNKPVPTVEYTKPQG